MNCPLWTRVPQDWLTTTPSIGAREGQPGSSMRWKSCRRPTTSPGRTLTPQGMTSSFRQQYALMVGSFLSLVSDRTPPELFSAGISRLALSRAHGHLPEKGLRLRDMLPGHARCGSLHAHTSLPLARWRGSGGGLRPRFLYGMRLTVSRPDGTLV